MLEKTKNNQIHNTSIFFSMPEDWEIVKALDFIDYLKGGSFSSDYFNNNGEGIPIIRIRDLGYKKTESYFNGDYSNDYVVKKGDLLISMDGEFNIYRWQGPPGLLNQRVCKVWSKNERKLNNIFLYYAIQKPLKLIELKTSSTTVKHLLDKDIKKLSLVKPPIKEQQKIAQILSNIDDAIQKVDDAIERTERLKQGLMQELLTKGIGHSEFVYNKKLKDIVDVKYGKSLPKNKGSIPAIGSSGVYKHVKNYLISHTTIVIGRKGTAGKPHIINEASWPSDTTFYLTNINHQEIDLNYLYYYFLSHPLSGEHARTTLPSLKKGTLENFKINLPPLSEQQQIAQILSTVDKRLELEQKRKVKYQNIKKGLMDKLLTGKVRVKV